MQSLTLLLVQADLRWEDPAANRAQLAQILRGQPASDLIILPEMFSTGFSMQATELAENAENSPTVHWMHEQALAHRALVTGSLIVRDGEQFVNRFYACSPDGAIVTYDKRHLFRFAQEHKIYSPGRERVVFTWRGWRICPQVCYDLRFPVFSRARRTDLEDGYDYDLLIYVANWPQVRVSHWDALLRARAIENQAYVAAVNRVGRDGNNIDYNGHSAVYDPKGEAIVSPLPGEVRTAFARLDLEPLRSYRRKFPTWRDADHFTLS